jgi:hypothetical protein
MVSLLMVACGRHDQPAPASGAPVRVDGSSTVHLISKIGATQLTEVRFNVRRTDTFVRRPLAGVGVAIDKLSRPRSAELAGWARWAITCARSLLVNARCGSDRRYSR